MKEKTEDRDALDLYIMTGKIIIGNICRNV